MTAIQTLASCMVEVEEQRLCAKTMRDAKLAVLDVLGAAAAGSRTSTAISVRTGMGGFGPGDSPIWFCGETASLLASVVANSAASSALDLDDGVRSASGHPGAGIIPAAFALSMRERSTWGDFLTSVVVGYEVGVRIASSRDPARTPTFATGRWMSFATASSAAWLMRLNADQFAHALSIAGTLTPNMEVNAYSHQTGNSIKEGIPWSAAIGVMAADMAANKANGPLDILDHPDHFDAAAVTAASSDWAVSRNYFKFYSCCRWAHAAIDAILALRNSEPWIAEAEQIDVYTFERALRLNNSASPQSIEAAQYSIPFCVAVAARMGANALLVLQEQSLNDPQTKVLASRVKLHADPMLTSQFPRRTPARVVARLGSRVVSKEVIQCRGDSEIRPPEMEMVEKFIGLYGRINRDRDASRIATAVMEVDSNVSAASVAALLQ
jgi:2-methylcitrate dehydratase PrpD